MTTNAPAPVAPSKDHPVQTAPAKPRIGLICDFVEENWPSMDLVAGMLFDHLSRDHNSALQVTRICPPMRRRFMQLPIIGTSPVLRNADLLLNRFIDYGGVLKSQLESFDLFHLIDHSYSQLVHELPPGRAVVTCHDLDTFRCVLEPEREPRPRWFRAMTARILSGFRKAAHVVACSAATRDEIVRFGLHPSDRVTMVPHGVHPSCSPVPDTAAGSQLEHLLPSDAGAAVWLLNVGKNMARKRLDLLLHVLAEVRKRVGNVRLLRIGEALNADQLQLADRLGVAPWVTELGFVNREILAAAYHHATLLVHTAEAEGFGLPLVEAMACGCPVIATDLPVLREVGGTAATFCTVGDITGWANAVVESIQTSDENRESKREKCLANAARYSWAENALRIAEVYRQVLAIA